MNVLRLSRTLAPITTLGPGRRMGIWVQGCTLACPGCASQDTWDPAGGSEMAIDEITRQVLDSVVEHDLTGITLTGGEPLDQADALGELLGRIRTEPVGATLDVLMFTGYALPVARKRGADLLPLLDTIVAGRYRRDLPSPDPLLGSSNQQLVHFTDKGRERHRITHTNDGDRRRIQVVAVDGELVMVGIPHPGDLDRIRSGLHAQGVHLEEVSWAT